MSDRLSRPRCTPVAALLLSLLVSACSTTQQPLVLAPETALPPSADRFWQHISEGHQQDWFHPLNGGEEALNWRLHMIDSAHSAIDMETFLWLPDIGGKRVLAHLLAAADRGVKVRILLDDSFTPHQDLVLHDLAEHPNIELRIYNPYRNRPASMAGRTLLNLNDFNRVNHRLHNKTLTVDGWASNVGGRNLASEYFGLNGEHNFRDMEILTMGASVATVSQHFDNFWNSGWSFPIEQLVERPAHAEGLKGIRQKLAQSPDLLQLASEQELESRWRTLADGAVPGRAEFVADQPAQDNPANAEEEPGQLARYLEDAIAMSRTEVTLVTAYLIPTEELLRAIDRAIDNGARVRILTNSLRSNNHLTAHAAYRGYIQQLLASGVALFEMKADASDRNLYMQDPVADKALGLHAKFMLLDDSRVFIGSSNLDPRSLKLNTEVGLMVQSQQLNQMLRDTIAVDFQPRNAWQVTLDDSGQPLWSDGGEARRTPPADSVFQQLEDWFIGLLPIDSQM
jgi:cardiolipin synthase C